MRYAYNDEIFMSDHESRFVVAMASVFGIVGLVATILYPMCFLFLVIALILFLPGYLPARKRYKLAMKKKQYAKENGYASVGKIINAGGGKEKVTTDVMVDNQSSSYTFKENNYWIEVEFIDAMTNTPLKVTANKINKSMRKEIGKTVTVYTYTQQWKNRVSKLCYVELCK